MSNARRPVLLWKGRPVDRVVHPKTGRRRGEKRRAWLEMARDAIQRQGRRRSR